MMVHLMMAGFSKTSAKLLVFAILAAITVSGVAYSGDGTGSSGPDQVTTDANGEFSLNYSLAGTNGDGSSYVGQEAIYLVEVSDSADTVLATTSFTDSYFRFGHISWTRTPGTNTVEFTVTTAWRVSPFVRLNWGDGGFADTSQGGMTALFSGTDPGGATFTA